MQTKTYNKPVDEVVNALLGAIEAQGMRLVAHINGQANAAKLGKTVPADQILEIFRPDFAIRVWDACKPAGMDIPLRVHVYENSAGEAVVAYRTPSDVFQAHGSDALMTIAAELDPIFAAITAAAD